MKLMRTLFQAAVLTVIMGVFSQHLLAFDYGNVPIDKSAITGVHSAPAHVGHLSALAILTRLSSQFVGGMISLVTVALVGVAIWLSLPPQRVSVPVEEELPVEIPPLRPNPGRVTKF